MQPILQAIKFLPVVFILLIVAYAVGRMFGLGMGKSLAGYKTKPISPTGATAKGEKQ